LIFLWHDVEAFAKNLIFVFLYRPGKLSDQTFGVCSSQFSVKMSINIHANRHYNLKQAENAFAGSGRLFDDDLPKYNT